MKLSIFDFIISHRFDKTNLIDTSLKRSNYKNENKLLNRFLFTL